MDEKQYYVYILMNKHNTVLYIGITNNLLRRIMEHKNHKIRGFSDHYNTTKLVYYEVAPSAYSAILREKQIKKWSRKKKDAIIDSFNPERKDLFPELYRCT